MHQNSSQIIKLWAQYASDADSGTVVSSKGHLLVVDDEPGMRSLLSDVFQSEGYKVTTCDDAQQACQLFSQAEIKIDLIICDQNMPRMTGLELLGRTQSMERKIPFILITAFGSQQICRQAMQEGAFAYMMKPFPLHELNQLVEKGLRQILK